MAVFLRIQFPRESSRVSIIPLTTDLERPGFALRYLYLHPFHYGIPATVRRAQSHLVLEYAVLLRYGESRRLILAGEFAPSSLSQRGRIGCRTDVPDQAPLRRDGCLPTQLALLRSCR